LNIEGMKSEMRELERQMQEDDFWQDQNRAKAISQQASELREEIAKWDDLLKRITELEQLVAVAQKEKTIDDTLEDELQERS